MTPLIGVAPAFLRKAVEWVNWGYQLIELIGLIGFNPLDQSTHQPFNESTMSEFSGLSSNPVN
jgi:hypothetical protein